MRDDQKSGLALVAGSLGGIVTMAVHPTGAAAFTPQQLDHLATLSGYAHTLAMLSYLAVFLGALGLTFHLARVNRSSTPDRTPAIALIVYGFASVALLLATAVSGFIVPSLMHHMLRDTSTNLPIWRIVIDAVFEFNQAFARIYSVAVSSAILLWSASVLRSGGLARGVAVYGCVSAPILMALLAVRHLQLDVHGMAIVVVAHALWFIAAGAQLCRDQPHVLGA